jgi:hypothetical protein
VIRRIIAWIVALFAGFKAGKASGVTQVQTAETADELEVSHAVNQAETAAPSDRAGTADELRRGKF